MKMLVLLSALAGCATIVFAQGTLPAYPLESEIRLQVWNGTSWGSTVNALPGQQVEYRVVMSYTGPRTDLLGLGDSRYQISFSNADNIGLQGDRLIDFPEGGWSTGPGINPPNPARNMLSSTGGEFGGPLGSYGRVTYAGVGQTFASQNALTNFRHGGGQASAGAPPGSWLRVGGASVTQWPADTLPTASDASPDSLNRINRGISASQPSLAVAGTNFASGTSNLVVFRHAVVLGASAASRTMEVSILPGSLLRVGGFSSLLGGSADDRRYIAWHESPSGGLGTYRTSVAIVPATIVIPTPGVLALLSVSGVLAKRRRR